MHIKTINGEGASKRILYEKKWLEKHKGYMEIISCEWIDWINIVRWSKEVNGENWEKVITYHTDTE